MASSKDSTNVTNPINVLILNFKEYIGLEKYKYAKILLLIT